MPSVNTFIPAVTLQFLASQYLDIHLFMPTIQSWQFSLGCRFWRTTAHDLNCCKVQRFSRQDVGMTSVQHCFGFPALHTLFKWSFVFVSIDSAAAVEQVCHMGR